MHKTDSSGSTHRIGAPTTRRPGRFLIVCSMVLCLLTTARLALFATVPIDHAIQLSVQTQKNPPTITLNWLFKSAVTAYTIYRRTDVNGSWVQVAKPAASATSFVDTDVTIGNRYEYKITGASMAGIVTGYAYSGIEVPRTEDRGTIVLLVDNTMSTPLATELSRLVQDLTGDGWTIIRHDIARTSTPSAVKALIQADYHADPYSVKSVFLFGHVPMFFTANMAPDGHAVRPWPADAYYGDMDGSWPDNSVTTIPSPLELQVGRVDLFSLPTFAPLTETDLLRRYLNKDHNYRHRLFNTQQQAIIDDNFGEFAGEAFAQNGWRNFPLFVGAANTIVGEWTTPVSTPYLWAYGCGGGNYISAGGVAATSDLRTCDPAVFTFLFGSYFGQWDASDDFLRAELATPNYGLTCGWAGRPNWFVHHMALGETIGFSTLLTQNNTSTNYEPAGSGSGLAHTALMGDPTLRTFMIAPPRTVTATFDSSQEADVSWTASSDSVLGYNVYKSYQPEGPFALLNGSLLTGLSLHDPSPYPGRTVYMVKAIGLQTTQAGSYFDASQGTMVTVNNPQDYLPDLWVRNAGETSYIDDGVYDAIVKPSKSQSVAKGSTVTYQLVVQNDGTGPDSFTVTGPPSDADWNVRYFDANSGGIERTQAIQGTGWTTPTLSPGSTQELRVEVTPGLSAVGGSAYGIRVQAASTTKPANHDAVTLNTVPFSVPTLTGITPSYGPNCRGILAIGNLAGTDLMDRAGVKLTRTGQADIYATSVHKISPTMLTCDFDLTYAAPGKWNLVILNPDGGTTTLADGFTIVYGPSTVITSVVTNGVASTLGGSISPTTAHPTYFGGSVTFTATPNPGYTVNTWSVDGTPVQLAGTTFTLDNITTDPVVQVSFTSTASNYTVTPMSTKGGSLTPSTAQTVAGGGSVTFTTTPTGGQFRFYKWYVDGVMVQSIGQSLTLTNVNANRAVQASYTNSTDPITVTPVAGPGGSVSPNTAQTVTNGDNITITAAPNTGWSVGKWLVDGLTAQTGGTSFTLTGVVGTHTVLAIFLPQLCTITPGAGAGGSIAPNTGQTIAYGCAAGFTATPSPGYSVKEWQVDGVTAQTGGLCFLLNDTAANHSVNVVFTPVPILSVKDCSENANITLTGKLVTAVFPDITYISEQDRTTGIGVQTTTALLEGDRVTIYGHAITTNGERVLAADSVTIDARGQQTPAPLAMSNDTVGGSQRGAQMCTWSAKNQQGWRAATGVNNIGTLVRVWGRVLSRDFTNKCFYIDDGCGLLNYAATNHGLKVRSEFALPDLDSYVGVTGVASCEKDSSALNGELLPIIRVRHEGDVLSY